MWCILTFLYAGKIVRIVDSALLCILRSIISWRLSVSLCDREREEKEREEWEKERERERRRERDAAHLKGCYWWCYWKSEPACCKVKMKSDLGVFYEGSEPCSKSQLREDAVESLSTVLLGHWSASQNILIKRILPVWKIRHGSQLSLSLLIRPTLIRNNIELLGDERPDSPALHLSAPLLHHPQSTLESELPSVYAVFSYPEDVNVMQGRFYWYCQTHTWKIIISESVWPWHDEHPHKSVSLLESVHEPKRGGLGTQS